MWSNVLACVTLIPCSHSSSMEDRGFSFIAHVLKKILFIQFFSYLLFSLNIK